MAYCSTADVMDRIRGLDLTVLGDSTAQQAALSEAAESASAEVDARCRRTFVPPTAPETRLYNGHGGFVLRTEDLVRLDAVTVEGVEAGAAKAYPLLGPPYGWIATGARFPQGFANVAITGLWGFAEAVPDEIGTATANLAAADLLGRLQAARANGVRMAVAGQSREEYPDAGPYAERIVGLEAAAARILTPFRRWLV